MKLTIVTPEKTIYDGEAISVAVPGTKGVITVKTADGVQEFTVRSGFIEVARNSVSICAEE